MNEREQLIHIMQRQVLREILVRNRLRSEELWDMVLKYDILKYIDACYEVYIDMEKEDVIKDVEKYIIRLNGGFKHG